MSRLAAVARFREGRPWMTNVALCLLGLALLMLTRQFVSEHDHFTIGFSGASGWSEVVYVAALLVVMTQPVNRGTFWIVIGFAVAFRMMTIFVEPFLSSDIYRYVWDGIAQHAHVNPYRYVPGDAALAYLREPNQDVFDNINRRDYAKTIYPPVAQMIYWVATFFSPTVQAMKFAMLGFEAVTVGALVALLRRLGRCREDVLLYAWCPLLVWEIGDAGHIDAAVMAFVALALLFRWRSQPVLVGLFLGAAVLTKFYPIVLFPALYQRRDWKMPAVMVGMAAAGYAVYSSVGWGVLGFMGGYTKEEGIDTGVRYFVLQWLQSFRVLSWLTVPMYGVLCAAVMGGITWWAWRRATLEAPGRDGAAGRAPEFVWVAFAFGFALMLLFSPHYPWYVAWLVPFVVLAPNLPLLAYLMGFFYLFTTAMADGTPANMFRLNERLYGIVGIAAVVGLVLRRWPIGTMFVSRDRKPYDAAPGRA